MESNGYTFSFNNYRFVIFYQIDNQILSQLQKYIHNYTQPTTKGSFTICVEDEAKKVGIYQITHFMNLFSICPSFMHDMKHVNVHVQGILHYIHQLVKNWSNVQVANEVRYKIAFYQPSELSGISCNNWPGNWRLSKNTNKSICGRTFPSDLAEYATRWSFDENFQVRNNTQIRFNLGGWGNNTSKNTNMQITPTSVSLF